MEPKVHKHNNSATPVISSVSISANDLSVNVGFNLQLNLKQLQLLIDRTDLIHKMEQQPKFFPIIFLVSKYLRFLDSSIPNKKDFTTVKTSKKSKPASV